MTRTQYFVAASLDGFIADANHGLDWLFQFDGAEGVVEHYQAFLADVGAIVMGSRTYEFLLRTGEPWPYVGRPTWVFTHRTLPTVEGADLRFVSGDVVATHDAAVAAAAGKNVWLVGGGALVAEFVREGRLDEIWLGLAPVALGSGAPLLPTSIVAPMTLESVTRFGKGFVELRYTLPGRSGS